MPQSEPKFCRPVAYHQFAAQLPVLDTAVGLLRAATAVANHELADAECANVEAEIESLAARVRKRVSSTRSAAVLAHVHRVLFDEEGFSGNPGDYYNARNSYLPCVLESKRGIPISLVLIYKCVAEGAGLEVNGINTPGHFLAEVEMDGRPTLIDPFYNGRMLTRDEAIKQIEGTTGRPASPMSGDSMRVDHTDPMFKPASHREWLARLIRNLRSIFAETGRQRDVEAMGELFNLL